MSAVNTAHLYIKISENHSMFLMSPVISTNKLTQTELHCVGLLNMESQKVENMLHNFACLLISFFKDSWESAIYVYTALDLFIVEKDERAPDIM